MAHSLEEAENTIERLQQEMEVYKERIHLFTYVIYGLIVSVVWWSQFAVATVPLAKYSE